MRGDPEAGLVFVRLVNGSFDLARVRISDGETRALTRTQDRDEIWPYWSEVARRLVFQRSPTHDPRGHSKLWSWSSAIFDERILDPDPERDERWPAWSPTEPQLAFAFRRGTREAGILLHRFESTEEPNTLLAHSHARDYFLRPSFSPDGRQLVAQRRETAGTGSRLWLLTPGSEPRALTGDPEWRDLKARFTRSGDAVIYTRRPAAGGRHEIACIELDDLSIRTLPSPPGSDNHSATPSPTRDEYAFVSEYGGSADIYLADFANGAIVNLTRSTDRNELAPRWSPNGEFLVMTTGDSDAGELRLGDRESLSRARIRVIDREGRMILDIPGLMPDWMAAW